MGRGGGFGGGFGGVPGFGGGGFVEDVRVVRVLATAGPTVLLPVPGIPNCASQDAPAKEDNSRANQDAPAKEDNSRASQDAPAKEDNPCAAGAGFEGAACAAGGVRLFLKTDPATIGNATRAQVRRAILGWGAERVETC